MEPFRGKFNPLRTHNLQESVTTIWLRNINLISIDYGFRPRLRCRLTLRGLTLAQKPLDFRRRSFSLLLSLLMSAFALLIPPGSLAGIPSQAYRTFRYQLVIFEKITNPQIRYMILAPLHLRRRNSIRPVSCYAIFKGWLLLSQPPGC